jgi:hypothetical protein
MRIAMNKFVQLLGCAAKRTLISPMSPICPIRPFARGLEIFMDYNGLQRITTDYNGLQRTFFKKPKFTKCKPTPQKNPDWHRLSLV